jgi:hypothetical protein
MDKSGTHIDLVFRNGLKDFEVLPPTSVWEGIQPVIAKKQRPFIFFRAAAAAAAVIISSVFFLYQYTRQLSENSESRILAFNVASSPVLYQNSVPGNGAFSEKNEGYPNEQAPILTSGREEGTKDEMVDNIVVPLFKFFPVNNNLNISRLESGKRSFSPIPETPEKSSFSIEQTNVISLADYGTVKPPERWSIAAMASPTYYSGFNSGSTDASSQLSSSEQSVVSYSGGVALTYKINKRFSVQSGLYYSSLGQQVDGINSFAGFQGYVYSKGDHNFEVLTTNGTIFINNRDVFLTSGGQDNRVITAYNNDVFDPKKASLDYIGNSIQQNFSYLEVPVVLRYKLIDRTIDINMTGGLSYNMLVGNSAYTVVDGTKYTFGETKGLNSFMVSSSFGMGMEYSFSARLSLNLEPTFRYFLNPFTGASSSSVHPYSFGVFSGLSYKF